MATRWTDEQLHAITCRDGNILVSAAAGSGKTAVLVERIFSMLADKAHPIDIDNLLVVTFTNAAAAEMKERVEERLVKCLDEEPDNDHIARQLASIHSAQIMTIDSFCLYVIRNHFNEIDLDPAFRIGEETELKLLRGDVVKALLEERYAEGKEDFLDFVECFSKGKMDQGLEELILQVYEYSRSYPFPRDWLLDCKKAFEIESSSALETLAPVQFLKDYIRTLISELSKELHRGLELCADSDGPVFYAQMLEADLKLVQALERCENLTAYYETFSGLSFMPLSRKKMADASDAKKQQVKNIRAFVKDTLTELQKSYFLCNSAQTVDSLRQMAPRMAVLIELVNAFSENYQKAKKTKNMVDFGDMEHFALEILTRKEDGGIVPTEIAKELSGQYAEILIDEYQDSNQVQETILTSISKERLGTPNVFMVGDVKQSIYKFRLAKPELFMEKYKTYPAKGKQYVRIELHKNFRSRSVVLDSVNYLFRRIMAEDLGDVEYDDDAALYPGASFLVPEDKSMTYADQAQILLIHGDSADAKTLEAQGVAVRIRELVEGEHPLHVVDKITGQFRPVGYGDIVILLRTMSGWADTFVKVLNDENIPAQAETVTGFFSTVEIRTVLSWLSVIDNPRQDIALAAVMKSPSAGFSDEELAMIRCVLKSGDFYDACRAFLKEESQASLKAYYDSSAILAAKEKLSDFMGLLDSLRQCVPYTAIHELILKIYEDTGCYAYASAMPGGNKRRANMDMLLEKAVAYERTSYRGLFNFIRYIEKLKQYEVDFGEAAVGNGQMNAVRIMSIHKSKGLEYPVVIVSGLGKRFNQQDAASSLIIHSDFGFGPDVLDIKERVKTPSLLKKILAKKTVLENLGEELRVLYVALTRAKEMLIMTGYTEDLEKSVERWTQGDMDGNRRLSFGVKATAKSYLDWIMPVFYGEADAKARFLLRIMDERDILAPAAHKSAAFALKKEALLHWDCDREYVPGMGAAMKPYLTWEYPFTEEISLHQKMSVSELKHFRQLADGDEASDFMADFGDAYASFDREAKTADGGQPLTDKDGMARAVLRGTTVHKLLERMDMGEIHSLKDICCLADRLEQEGQIDPKGRELVYMPGLLAFAKSQLARRMAAAAAKGCLYREKQFVMGIPAADIKPSAVSSEMMLVQGIIDAWFIEDGEIVLVDYKTDYVGDDGTSLVHRYAAQLRYYARALEQITGLSVKERVIYSLGLGKALLV